MDRLLQNIDLDEINNNVDMMNVPDEQKDFLNQAKSHIDKLMNDTTIGCDTECQNNKKENELYKKYMKARENEKRAPEKLETAERNYYVFSKGDYKYNKMKEKEYVSEAEKIISILKSEFKNKYDNIKLLLNNVKEQNTYNTHIDDLANTYNKNNKELEEDIQNTESSANIANQKSKYFNHYNIFINWISKMLYRINILMTILFVILIFISKKSSKRFYQISSFVLIVNLFLPYILIIKKIY